MLTGSLRAQGVHVCEVRVRDAMMFADPVNYARRQIDIARRFNPVPYNAQYFGHKLHIDLNEKLVHYNCLIVGAIDGFSGLIVSLFTIHRKNCIDLNKMYEELLMGFGIWDQIRVDQGHEFYLMCYLQYKLKDLRYNQNRNAYVQTTSRMVF